ncbi:MAG TPA: hypothetical protein VFO39_11650 [Candidatus Sulfotelmatobacter sp.]|nr:hypothetical protein [Candidatus Sulfotelmatobacter sp.]
MGKLNLQKCALCLTTAMFFAHTLPAQNTAIDHFARGKQLIEANCIDCEGGTQQGEEEGIRELELVTQSNDSNTVAAYKLLAEAYANMTTYVDKNPSESDAYRAKEYEVYRKLYRLAPNDPEVLQSYEPTLTDVNEKIAVCRKIVSLKPEATNARFELGTLLLQQGQLKEAVQQMQRAITEETNAEAVRNDTERVIEAFQQRQCPLKDAEQLHEQVYKAEEAATSGEGDPKPMAAFKNKFAAALEQQSCNTPAPK